MSAPRLPRCSRRRPALLPGALLAACLAAARSGAGAGPGETLDAVTVVIAPAPPSQEEIRRRAAAELAAAGFHVSLDDCAPGLQLGCAEAWPAGARAVVALGFAVAGGAVAIDARIARAEDERPVRLQALIAGPPPPEPAVVAVRAAELVRAGVLAFLRAEAPPGPVVSAPGVVAAPSAATPAPSAVFLGAGPALVQSTAGLGSAWGPELRLGVTLPRGWFAAAWLIAPTLAPELRGPAGSAELRAQLGGLELGRRWRPAARLGLALTFGGGGYHLAVRGKEVAPLPPASSSLWTLLGAVGGRAAWALGERWACEAGLRLAFVRTAPVVRIGATQTGGGGWPLVLASLGVTFQP